MWTFFDMIFFVSCTKILRTIEKNSRLGSTRFPVFPCSMLISDKTSGAENVMKH